MTDNFEKLDKEWMEKTRPVREKKIAPAILSHFSWSVEKSIRERHAEKQTAAAKPKRVFSPLLAGVPVFAVLLIGVAVVLRLPSGTQPSMTQTQPAQLAQAPLVSTTGNTADDISRDVAVLRELGVWTDEDEKNVGVESDASLDELELTDAGIGRDTRLA